MATPTIREVVSGGAVDDVTVATGAGTTSGDLLVIIHGMDWDTAAQMTAPTVPAGVGVPQLQATGDHGTNSPHIKMWTAAVTSNGAKSISSNGVAGDSQVLHVYVLAGANATPEDAAGSSGDNETTHLAPSVSADTSDGLMISAVMSFTGGAYSTAVMTERADTDVSGNCRMASASLVLSATGATGTKAFTKGAPTASEYASASIIIGGAGGVARAMAGTANSAADATGTLSRARAIAGTSDSAASATGTLASSIELAGTATSVARASGELQTARPLASTTDSAATATGALQSTLELAATTTSTGSGLGTLASTIPLAVTTTSASSGSGTLQLTRALDSTSTSVSTATGALSSELDLVGTTDSAASGTGLLEVATSLAGVTDSISSASGELSITGQVDLAGTTTSTATASGAITGTLALTGTATSTSSGTATLSIAGVVELEGTTLGASSGSGTLTGTTQFEGTANAADGATGQLTVTAEVKRDTMVLPIAENLLACLCEAVAEAPNPPASCCLRPGVTVAQGVSEHEDECCEGLAWVRVSRVWPTGSEVGFPAINDDPFNCSPISYGIEMEMGIYRCAPTGDERNLPTCDEWTATTEQILDDAASMRRAWCCFRDNYDNSAKLVGQWIPVMVQGGCTGGTMTIMIESYCTDCVAEGS